MNMTEKMRIYTYPDPVLRVCTELVKDIDEGVQKLVEKMAETFINTSGDIKQVLFTLFSADEFWDKSYQAAKIKTPFELIVSTVRITNAQVNSYRPLIQWSNQIGQPLYAYQSPTGYPDNQEFWTNGSALLNRMNFANSFAKEQIEGLGVELMALNDFHEPESDQEALKIYLELLLPTRDIEETASLLLPVLADPEFDEKLKIKTESTSTSRDDQAGEEQDLAEVVGLILGSPEFQRQ